MALTKYKIGSLIHLIDERNDEGLSDFCGININKEFMPTVAATNGLDASKYKVVRNSRFVYSGMQTGRDKCIRISMYLGNKPIIVSPAYITFEINALKIIHPVYFFMLFLSKEKDRLGWFYSDGSIRSNLDWDDFCDIELSLPPLSIQQKYVDVYQALLANQKNYEEGLDDLKLTCDAYIEELRRKIPCQKIGSYLIRSDKRNETGLLVNSVRGIATSKQLIPTKANMRGVKLDNYKMVYPDQISFVPDTSRRGDKISLAINNTESPILVSSISEVFGTVIDKLLPSYLMLFFVRSEFDRYARFNSWGSAREVFTFGDMCDVKIPIPDIKTQKAISDIYAVYTERRAINERLKERIKKICPILIKGSLDEGERCRE